MRKSHTATAQADEEAPETGTAERDETLAEDAACCIAQIEAVLDDEQAKAEREFAGLAEKFGGLYDRDPEDWGTFDADKEACKDEIRVWQAQYAHLGLEVGWCCGVPHLKDAG